MRTRGPCVTTTPPVRDWATDYDIFDPAYVSDPFPIWDELRRACTVAHTDRWGGSWLPTRYEDVAAMAHDVEHFSSRHVGVVPPPEVEESLLPAGLPPISSDPPVHTWSRRLLLPWFSNRRVAGYEPMTRALCRSLIDGFRGEGHADAAAGYAQQIPVRVIAAILGVPADLADTFTGWVRDVLEFANDAERRRAGTEALITYFVEQLADRRAHPGDDLISDLLQAEVDGEPVPDDYVLGTAALTLIAGVDTTWSAIGSSLWHLATHPEDRTRLIAEPEMLPIAIEELLRAYSPVTMARIVAEDTEVAGCPMKAGDRVLMNFPAANRDPDAFPDADRVVIGRMKNRHVAFGVGIHRCAGSNLARMELRVALEEWLARIPEFRLADAAVVSWAGGQVRGPRSIPVVFP
ncbi:MAG: cytochrome P450 [Acidimicrobiales bacterium]